MTIAELIKSTIDSSKERMKMPIVGSFVCSFLIYNWRPLYILFYSDEAAELRIKTVNLYFTGWNAFFAIVVPFGMVAVYTFLVPMLMVWIDEKLRPTKEKRITGIYLDKDFTIKKKINYALEEFKLKQSESGNKEIQDLLDEIETLKNTIKQKDESSKEIAISNKNNLDQLTDALKISNTLREDIETRENEQKLAIESLEKDLNESRRSTYFARDISSTLRKLNTEVAKKFMDLKEEEGGRLIFRLTSNRKDSLQKFWELKLVEKIAEDHYIFTDLGSTIYNILHLDSQLKEVQNKKSEEDGKLNELASVILANWDASSVLSIKMSSSGIIDQSNIDSNLLENLENINVLERTIEGKLKITKDGKDFIKFLQIQQQQYIEANKLGNITKM